MATLRNLIDGRSLDANATQDVFDHLKKAKKAKLKNDMANIKLQTKLAPTRQLIQLVDQEHPMPGQAPGQQQQFDQNGNPVNLQNPQLDNQGNPMPNQAPPMKPGIGQPNVAKGNQNIQQQKKPGFPNANKTSTKDKLDNDKNKKQVGGKKGVEIHVKAGGPGSGRRSSGGTSYRHGKMSEKEYQKRIRKHSFGQNNSRFANTTRDGGMGSPTERSFVRGKSEKIDQLNVKKKKIESDYHNDAGMSQMPSRGVGLSGGGPGSGRHAGINRDKFGIGGRPKSFGSQSQKNAHSMLTKAGFHFKKSVNDPHAPGGASNLTHVYTHPDNQDMRVYSNGSWNHGMQGEGSPSKLSGHLRSIS